MNSSPRDWLKTLCAMVGVGALALASTLHAQSPWASRVSGTTANLWGAAASLAPSTGRAAVTVVVGEQGTILTSTDEGVSWTRQNSGTTAWLTAVTYIEALTRFFSVGEGGIILTSPDGVTWTRETSPTTVRLNAVSAGVTSPQVYAVGEASAGLLVRDQNGIWSRMDPGFGGRWLRGLSSGNAAGQGGSIFSLATGQQSSTPSTADLEAIASGYASGTQATLTQSTVVVGAEGTILQSQSSSGISTWLVRPSGTTQRLRGICFKTGSSFSVITLGVRYGIGEYFVVGAGGTILRSADGMGWQPDPSPTQRDLNRVVVVGQTVITVGSDGTILQTGGNAGSIPSIARQPVVAYDGAGRAYLEGEGAGDGALTYFWGQMTGGAPYPVGGDHPRQLLPRPTFSGFPVYQLFVGNAFGLAISNPVAATGFLNLSSRAVVGPNEKTLIGGFAIASSNLGKRTVLVRAIGPMLANFGVANPLRATRLTVFSADKAIAANTGWSTNSDPTAIVSATQRIGAFALPNNSADSVLLLTLDTGNYTAQVESADGTTGVALVEVYDVDPPALIHLSNLSARAQVQTGENVLTGGFVISSGLKKKVLLRAAGPALAAFGVQNTLAQPKITLFRGATVIATAVKWSAAANVSDLRTAATAIGAFAFPEGSADAALLVDLDPGAYTFQVSGADGGTGIALAEVYEQPMYNF